MENNTKPISVLIQEARDNIAKSINETNLNPFLLEPIIKDFYNEILVLKEQQYKKDLEEYQQSLKENKKDDE